MDFSCIDNTAKKILPNSIDRETFNYAQMVERLYQSNDGYSSERIYRLLKRHNDKDSTFTFKITSLRHVLKYREAVPHLIQLLSGGGGVWTGDCEAAYNALMKCKVEKVSDMVFLTYIFSLFFNRRLLLFLRSVLTKAG